MQTAPVFVSSGDVIADRRFEFAKDLEKRGELAGAADLYAQAAELAPAFASAWFALGMARARLGDADGAAAAFGQAVTVDPNDRHGAALALARLTGEPAPMPAGYVRALFDQYAKHFDLSLLEGLNYRGPQLLFDAVMTVCNVIGREDRFDRAFDLGCGTGLVSAMFCKRIDSLVGVDLSPVMVEQARRTGIYNHLQVAEVRDFLTREHDASADLVIAGDLLPYVCDLAPIAGEVGRVLEDGGLFALTTETHEGAGVLLRETLRYAHGEAHVREALASGGLVPVHFQQTHYRTEKGSPVPGLVVVAVKAASTAPSSVGTS
ncbi:MAG: methyltransferase domain-containing protein [Xanthobacteraceae bacterium]